MIDINRWFGGVTGQQPEEEESAVSKTLRMLQTGATDAYNTLAAPVSPALGESVRGAVSSAYDALPSLPTPAPGTLEAAEHEEVLRRRGQVSSAVQTAAPVIQQGATGLYDAAQDPSNAVETGKRAIQAGYTAAADAYVPNTPAEIATAAVMPMLHVSNVAQAGWNAATDEIGRGLGRAAGTSTDPLVDVPGLGPVSSEDIAGQAAQVLLDPTNLIGAPAAKAAVRAAPRVGRELAEGAVRAGSGVLDDVGRRAVDAVTGANLTPAARAAQAAALPAEQGAGFLPSHANDMRTRIIPPDVADTLDFPVRIPEDPFVLRAIEAAGGTVDERGTTLNVIRNQGPEAAGGVATRGMTYHIAGPPGTPNPFTGSGGIGGSDRLEGPTRFRNPLFISQDAGGTGYLDDALEQLGVASPPNAEEIRRTQSLIARERREIALDQRIGADDMVAGRQRHLQQLESDLERLQVPQPVNGRQEIDEAINAIRRRTPKASPQRTAALQDLVARYGGDPSVVPDLVKLRGSDTESGYAIIENIIGEQARRKGHDGVIYLGRTPAAFEDVNAHPAVKEAQDAYNAAFEEASDAHAASREWHGRWRRGEDTSAEEEFRVMNRAHTAQQRLNKAQEAVVAAEKQAQKELGGARIDEVADPREGRNPTPGAPGARIQSPEARAALGAQERAANDYAAAKEAYYAIADREGFGSAAARAAEDRMMDAGDEMQRLAREAEALGRATETVGPPGPPGYTLRPDLPRRSVAPPEAASGALRDLQWQIAQAERAAAELAQRYGNDASETKAAWQQVDALEAKLAGMTPPPGTGSGEQGSRLGAGLQSLLPSGGVRGQLRADAYNAAQGGVFGAASESLEAGAEDRETDFGEQIRRGAIGAGMGVLAGRGIGRRGVARAAQLGSGVVPSGGGQNTGAQLGQAVGGLGAHMGTAMRQADLAAAEKRMADLRASQGLTGAEHDAALAATPLGQQIARLQAEIASGAAPSSAASQTAPSGPPAASGVPRYRPELSAEPVLPGLEPPRRAPGDAGPDISDVPNRPPVPGDFPRERQVGIAGMGEELLPEMARSGREGPALPHTPSLGMRDALPGLLQDLGRPQDPLAAAGPPSAALPGVPPLRTGAWNHVVDALKTVGEKTAPHASRLQIVRLAGMLSDTAGQAMNVGSNVGLLGRDLTTAPLMLGMDMARSAVSGRPREVFAAELGARAHGMRVGARAGLSDALEILRSGTPAAEASKLDSASGFGTDIPGIAPKGSKAAKVADFAVEAPLRFLGAADAVFRTMAQGGHLMAEATAAAMKANGGKAVTEQQVLAAARDPELLERVQQLAQRSVLQEERAPTTAVRKFLKESGVLGQAASLELPFVKTPYNVVAQGMEMSPVGLAGVIKGTMDGSTPRVQQRRLAEVSVGTASMGIAAMLYANGNMTGAYPETEKERSMLPPGWKPWSLTGTMPNGATVYLPFENLAGPLAVPAVMTITAMEAEKKGAEPLSWEMAGKVAAGVGKYMIEQTFFEGFANIAGLVTHPDRNLERHLEQFAAQYSPHALGGGALGRQIQRIAGMPNREPEGVLDALKATHPLLAGEVAEKQDVLGRPASRGLSGPAAVITRGSEERDAPVLRAFRRAGEGLPMQAPKSIPDPDTGAPRRLSERQQQRWRRAFGSALQQEWADWGGPADSETLRKVETAARTAANDTLLGRR